MDLIIILVTIYIVLKQKTENEKLAWMYGGASLLCFEWCIQLSVFGPTSLVFLPGAIYFQVQMMRFAHRAEAEAEEEEEDL